MWPNDGVVQTPDLLLSTISIFQDLKSDHIFMSVPVAPASTTGREVVRDKALKQTKNSFFVFLGCF